MLCDLDITFGLSLDGPEKINDANRVDHRGGGSYARVRRAIDLILADSRTHRLFGGLLTVINWLPTRWRSTIIIARWASATGQLFLLPDGHYDNPPAGLSPCWKARTPPMQIGYLTVRCLACRR